MQWHLFAVSYLGCAGYVLLVNEHVRGDVLSSRWSARTCAWVDIAVMAGFALPVTGLVGAMSAELFLRRFATGEISFNAGGFPV